MKYCYIVKELATLGANWKFYDENFRKLRESQGYHGIKIIPNCGWGPIPFAPNQIPSHGNPRSSAPSFPKVTTGNSIEAFIALDAPLSISVFDAGNHTPLPNAPSQNLTQVKGQSPAFPLSGALPTPVKVERLAYYLEGYNVQTYEELLSGFWHGFRLQFQGPKLAKFPLPKEVLAGRVLGPFKHPTFDNFRVSPLGVIPKETGWWTKTDPSSPVSPWWLSQWFHSFWVLFRPLCFRWWSSADHKEVRTRLYSG